MKTPSGTFVKVYYFLVSSCLKWRSFSLQTSDKDQTPLPDDKPEDKKKKKVICSNVPFVSPQYRFYWVIIKNLDNLS